MRVCGICDIEHRCHCSRLMAFCRVCLPAAFEPSAPLPPQSEYARRQGEDLPAPVRMRLVRYA